MLAKSRAAAVVDVPDFLAGIYIYEWDRLARFWEEHDEIEALLQRICQISPQRWHRWIEFYDKSRKEADTKPGFFFSEAKKSAKKEANLCRGRRSWIWSCEFRGDCSAPRHRKWACDSDSYERVCAVVYCV